MRLLKDLDFWLAIVAAFIAYGLIWWSGGPDWARLLAFILVLDINRAAS